MRLHKSLRDDGVLNDATNLSLDRDKAYSNNTHVEYSESNYKIERIRRNMDLFHVFGF